MLHICNNPAFQMINPRETESTDIGNHVILIPRHMLSRGFDNELLNPLSLIFSALRNLKLNIAEGGDMTD
jgi:hypothetical protein